LLNKKKSVQKRVMIGTTRMKIRSELILRGFVTANILIVLMLLFTLTSQSLKTATACLNSESGINLRNETNNTSSSFPIYTSLIGFRLLKE